MKAKYKKHTLQFKRPSGTSRGILTLKETWFIILERNDNWGIGECGLLKGLSIDDRPDYEEKLKWVCSNIHLGLSTLLSELREFPSIQFGLEQAFLSFDSPNPFVLHPSVFTEMEAPININGLIWMGDTEFMLDQIVEKLKNGFECIKMKIGAIDFRSEVKILESIRKKYAASEIELRVDANGAFSSKDAREKLSILSEYDLHSIEQPIKQGQHDLMADLCAETPLPIALDEELIGINGVTKKERLLQTIRPQYIILKPSLVGGYKSSQEWIDLAKSMNIGWWVTSALESNIGLNAIAQWTATLKNSMPQGLGTGALYTNNIDSPLSVANGSLFYMQNQEWDYRQIDEICT